MNQTVQQQPPPPALESSGCKTGMRAAVSHSQEGYVVCVKFPDSHFGVQWKAILNFADRQRDARLCASVINLHVWDDRQLYELAESYDRSKVVVDYQWHRQINGHVFSDISFRTNNIGHNGND